MAQIPKNRLASWIRQWKPRCISRGVVFDLSLDELYQVIDAFGGKCVFCPNASEGIATAFRIIDGAPFVQANTLPICRECRSLMREHDLINFHTMGYVSEIDLNGIISYLCRMRGNEHIRAFLYEAAQNEFDN